METKIPTSIHTYTFGTETINLFVPNEDYIKQWVQNHRPFPYWAQVWPAAKALCLFLVANQNLVSGKQVLEIAAGLGLPSLLTAHYASSVTITDHVAEAVETVKQSIQFNQLKNADCTILDWNENHDFKIPDVVLLSDVNYNPDAFAALYNLLERFIALGITIVLSTPHRLAGKEFMAHIQPWCIQNTRMLVAHKNEEIEISVWILKG